MFRLLLELVPAIGRYKFEKFLCSWHKESVCLCPCHLLQFPYPHLVLLCVLHHPGVTFLASQLTSCFRHQEHLACLFLKFLPPASFAFVLRLSLTTILRYRPTIRINHNDVSICTNNRLPVKPHHMSRRHLRGWTRLFPSQLLPVQLYRLLPG